MHQVSRDGDMAFWTWISNQKLWPTSDKFWALILWNPSSIWIHQAFESHQVFGIHQVSSDGDMAFWAWISNQKFWPTSNFWRYQFCQQTVHKITKFHLHFKWNRKVKLVIFSKKLIQRSQNTYEGTKINQ